MKTVLVVLSVVLMSGGLVLQARAATDPAKGEAIYEDRCSLCHPADGVGQGPSLRGVVGRPAGSLTGFAYTDALKASHLTWTVENLNIFLNGPAKLVPGTAMPLSVPDASERADLIAYLGTQK